MIGNGHAGFGRAASEKDPQGHLADVVPRHAPRGALLYPRRSREELEGMFLGPMAYPDPKGDRNNRLPGKRRSCPGVWGEASWDPCDMAKAGLLEAESP